MLVRMSPLWSNLRSHLSPRCSPTRVARFAPLAWGLAAVGFATGCSRWDGVSAVWEPATSLEALDGEAFFDHPFPSDLRREDGMPRFRGWYNPRSSPIIASYAEAMTGVVDGFSPVGATFLRFDGPLDPASLPADPLASLDERAAVQLIDVDPNSPARGTRHLVHVQFRADEGVLIRSNTLSVLPTLGAPLAPNTTYAVVVTRDALDLTGAHAQPSDTLAGVLDGVSSGDSMAGPLEPALQALEDAGIPRGYIAHLAVFTTADPTAELLAVRDHLRATQPAPVADPAAWELKQEGSIFDEYLGSYGPTPSYQVGTIPFKDLGDGGGFVFENGEPVVGSTLDLRFSLSVPRESKCPVPAGGYPIALYGHGTGGDYRSYVADGTARSLAEQCIASMGIDGLWHGTRPVGGAEALLAIEHLALHGAREAHLHRGGHGSREWGHLDGPGGGREGRTTGDGRGRGCRLHHGRFASGFRRRGRTRRRYRGRSRGPPHRASHERRGDHHRRGVGRSCP